MMYRGIEMIETNKLYLTDVMIGLKSLPAACIDMIFTSPPYYRLRNYNAVSVLGGDIDCNHSFNEKDICVKCGAWYGELGHEPHFNDFVKHLSEIFIECKRVLKNTGSLYINIGDTYNTDGFLSHSKTSKTKKYNEKNLISKYRVKDYPNKSLSLIPHRLAMMLIDNGYILRNTIIWAKRSAVPESVKDRFSKKHEYVFFFVKNGKYYFDINSIKKPYAESSISRIKYKISDTPSMIDICDRRDKMLNNGGANPGDISDFWSVSPSKTAISNTSGHVARFNIELLKKPILASCPRVALY